MVIDRLLNPFEKTVIAQKILAQHGRNPEVQKEFEKAFGVTQKTRTVKQWNNLVRVYGIETVAKIEGMTQEQVKVNCMKMSEQVKQKWKQSRVSL